MNTKVILLIFLALTLSCSDRVVEKSNHDISEHSPRQTPSFDLTGIWHWEEESSVFELTLKQFSDSLTGHYCAGYDDGNRSDCFVEGDECILHGRLKGNTAVISFTSCYAGATGQAVLTFNKSKDNLTWDIIKSEGEMYAPDLVIMTRNKTSH